MGRIAVVTTSVACVPQDLMERYNIHVVPFHVVWDDRVYTDGVDISPGEFYRLFRQSEAFPTTTQPSLADFVRTYAQLSTQAEGIVSIHVAEELTGAINVARMAAREAASVPIRLLDSRMATMAQGFIVLAAARTAASGASLDEVVAAAEAMIPRVDFFATLDDLKHLHRGGRIGEAATLLGSKLSINPILSLAHGRVRVLGVARSREKAVQRMIEMMGRQVGDRPLHSSVFHGDALEEAERIGEEIQFRFNSVEFYVTEFTPVMGAHTGPGVIGLAFYADQPDESLATDSTETGDRPRFFSRGLPLFTV